MPPPGSASPRPGILKQESYKDESHARDISPGSSHGPTYTASPRSTPKTVSIAPLAETISPLILGKQKTVDDFDLEPQRVPRRPLVKQPSARRLSGRPGISSPDLKPLTPLHDASNAADGRESPEAPQHSHPSTHHQRHSGHVDHLIEQVSAWISAERAARAKRRGNRADGTTAVDVPAAETDGRTVPKLERRASDASDEYASLNKLEDILKQAWSTTQQRFSAAGRRRPSLMRLHGRKLSVPSSETEQGEYFGDNILVPSCDAVLDNSRTVNYPAGLTDSSDESVDDELEPVSARRNVEAWASFKFEIVRLIHTLRLKGWRKMPLDVSSQIIVDRLSGALTNAVYVVSPPIDLPLRSSTKDGGDVMPQKPRKPPPKLLLRIYGPQSEHLIDREAELSILRRLARKRIAPRLLGTFANGRFEEFLNAKALTAEEMRNADTSRHIAKRMRELHDGIELLDKERDDGAFVWRNWDKWVSRVEEVVSWLDSQIHAQTAGVKPTGADAWKRRGFICGTEWRHFRKAVEDYRTWLNKQYGGSKNIREQLVFSHNDTQYGNILRVVPTGESPLLLPQNSHKQLVVIDFEYANANLRGLEFANHFTEWCYNYHDERKPYACNTNLYPTPDEQDRFIRAYVRHRPQFNTPTSENGPSTTSSTGVSTPARPKKSSSMYSDFMLDARNPHNPAATAPAASVAPVETAIKQAEDEEVARLMHETRLWRLANTAQWVAWGIVQAKVPGMPLFTEGTAADDLEEAVRKDLHRDAHDQKVVAEKEDQHSEQDSGSEVHGKEGEQGEQDEEFDYLGYVQHRAMFFWGDAIQLGLVAAGDVPEDVRAKIKTVPY